MIVQRCLLGLPERFPGLRIDSHVVMPNHAHVLFGFHLPRPGVDDPTLGAIVRHWKSMSCRLVRTGIDPSFGWQRNYHERILRDYEEIEGVRLYIAQNPARWDRDQENPEIDAPSERRPRGTGGPLLPDAPRPS